MGSAMFGYDSAFIGGALSLPSFKHDFGLATSQGNSLASLKANIVSTFQAGCFFGVIICYFGTEAWGRKPVLVASGGVFNLGVLLQVVSTGHLGLIYAGRVLTGLAVGASSMIVPVYIAECFPARIRGRTVGVFEIMLQAFQVIGFWINYGVIQNLPAESASQWQVPFAFQFVPGTLLMTLMLLQPESPRWLLKAGKRAESHQIFAKLRGLPQDHELIHEEMRYIDLHLEQGILLHSSGEGRVRGKAFLEAVGPRNRKRLGLGIAIMFLQNLVGANAINYYSPTIFASLGLTGVGASLLATGIYGIIKVISTLLFITFVVDRIGRRRPLLIGSVGIFTAMMYLGIYTYISGSFDHNVPRDGGAHFAIVTLYLFAVLFCVSWNSIAWIYCAEMFHISIRSISLIFTTCAQWLGQFTVVYSTPYMMANIKPGTFFFFAAATFVGFFFTFFLLPETAGLSLENIDMLFSEAGSARTKHQSLERSLACLDSARRDSTSKSGGVEEIEMAKV
ncbi:general substrate transporter, partial [Aureobasidium melanogenum]